MRLSGYRRDMAVNLATSVLVLGANLLFLREAARLLAPAVLGLLLLARRTSETLANLVQLGTPHAIRRSLAMSAARADRRQWLLSAGGLCLAAIAVFLAVAIPGRALWDTLLFGPTSTRGLFAASVWLTVAIALNNLSASTLMGLRRFATANLLQTVNGSGWILLGLWLLASPEPADLLWAQASGTLLVAAASLGIALWAFSGTGTEGPEWRAATRATATYALPRSVAPFLELTLFLVGPWLLRYEPAEAGALLLAFTVLRMANLALAPIASVGGIAASSLVGRDSWATLRRALNLTLATTWAAGLLLLAAGQPWLRPALGLWLGKAEVVASTEAAAAMVVLALPFYMVFQGIKPMIEAAWTQPRILYAMLASLATLFATAAIARLALPLAPSVLIATLAALIMSAVGAVTAARSELAPIRYFGLPSLFLCALAVHAANRGFAMITTGHSLAVQAATGAVVVPGTLLLAGWALLRGLRPPFATELWRVAVPRRSTSTPPLGG